MIAQLHIQTALLNNKTRLKKAYHTPPFKIADITEDKNDTTLRLMLMSSSPGVLDEDKYDIKIDVAKGCSLNLKTQSYQRLFSMKKGASQKMEVHMEEGASFYYLPHPTVPHKASDFVAENNIFLSPGCNLIWGEVLTCGRKLSGEEFKFSRYRNVIKVFMNGRLVIKENLLVRPLISDVNAIGQLEGYTHQASLLYLNELALVPILIKELHHVSTRYPDICFGISALPVNGLIVRLLGFKGEQLHNIQCEIAKYITRSINKPLIEVAKAASYAG